MIPANSVFVSAKVYVVTPTHGVPPNKFDKQTALPRKALPSDGIVPFLLKSAPVENQFVDFKLIPTEFYIG